MAVRQALAYATDRNAIVKQLFAPIQPDIKPINSFYTPAFGKVYTEPFGKYKSDLNMVTTLMTGDGWAKGSDGIWAKGGQKAALELKTTTGNKRRPADGPDPPERVAAGRLPADRHAREGGRAVRPGRAERQLPGRPVRPDPDRQRPGPVQPVVLARTSRARPTATAAPTGTGSATPTWTRTSPTADTNLDPTAQDRRRPGRPGHAGRPGAGASRSTRSRTSWSSTRDKIGVEGGTFQHNFASGRSPT